MSNIVLFEDIFVVDKLDPDGKKFDKGTSFSFWGGRKSLADKYEYIMRGKLYKISADGSGKSLKAEMIVSSGGLLMMLRGEASHVSQFELDQRLFLLMRKL
ncbi:hypothetical protein POUND7_019757 [Theobroma cacao]